MSNSKNSIYIVKSKYRLKGKQVCYKKNIVAIEDEIFCVLRFRK